MMEYNPIEREYIERFWFEQRPGNILFETIMMIVYDEVRHIEEVVSVKHKKPFAFSLDQYRVIATISVHSRCPASYEKSIEALKILHGNGFFCGFMASSLMHVLVRLNDEFGENAIRSEIIKTVDELRRMKVCSKVM